VEVDVKELGLTGVPDRETRFLLRFAEGGVVGCLAVINVPARLYPYSESSVTMQNNPATRDNKAARGDVMVASRFAEGVGGE
jgi:hypothetical protein